MRVYISAHDPSLARMVASVLLTAGHTVVSTWHEGSDARPAADDAEACQETAAENFDIIDSADVLVLVSGPDRYPGGKFVEAGYALKAYVEVYTYGDRVENGMMYAATHVRTPEELIEALS